MKIKLMWIFLIITPLTILGQIPYGNNPEAGKYIQTADAKIYYEIYGEGEPLVLIHGSLYGYIDEFTGILPNLSDSFKVIAVALRGHGKSEIGNRNYSYKLFAEDIIKIMDNENIDQSSLLGFSSGAITALKMASEYPARVKKVVSIAGALGVEDKRPEKIKSQQEMTGEDFVLKAQNFVDKRKKLMPEPARFEEFYEKLKAVDNDPCWVSKERASQISAEVFIVGGDRDEYFDVQAFVKIYSIIPGSKLLIVPNSGHVAVLLNRTIYLDYAIPFLKN